MRGLLSAALLVCASAAWGQGYESLKWGASLAEVKKACPGLEKLNSPGTTETSSFYKQRPTEDAKISYRVFAFLNNGLVTVVENSSLVAGVETFEDTMLIFINRASRITGVKIPSLIKEIKQVGAENEGQLQMITYRGEWESEKYRDTLVAVVIQEFYSKPVEFQGAAQKSFRHGAIVVRISYNPK
jgi:hypothetical protein